MVWQLSFTSSHISIGQSLISSLYERSPVVIFIRVVSLILHSFISTPAIPTSRSKKKITSPFYRSILLFSFSLPPRSSFSKFFNLTPLQFYPYIRDPANNIFTFSLPILSIIAHVVHLFDTIQTSNESSFFQHNYVIFRHNFMIYTLLLGGFITHIPVFVASQILFSYKTPLLPSFFAIPCFPSLRLTVPVVVKFLFPQIGYCTNKSLG